MKVENRIQQEIFTHHWNNYPAERGLLFMIHNNARDEMEGARLKSMGMVKGVADMCYLSPFYGTVFLEVKTEVGKQSPVQRKWESLVTRNGFGYHVVRSLEEVKTLLGWN